MPNDLYKWEERGGLVHHCPECHAPLTNPHAKTRCLGDHVEWCKGYHTQLFRKGTSSTCDPCCKTDEEHHKRHREIAELVLELKHIHDGKDVAACPLTPRAINVQDTSLSPSDTPKTRKKERKALKRAKKILELPKGVTAADVDFVASILHPSEIFSEDVAIERQMIEDPDFKLNRAYHKGTSNVRQLRYELIKKDKLAGSKAEFNVNAEDLDDLLQQLGVTQLAANASVKEKTLHQHLKDCIVKDLAQEQKEAELLTIRKAGFWRWANKKAYNRLLQDEKILAGDDVDSALTPVKPEHHAVTDQLNARGLIISDSDGEATDTPLKNDSEKSEEDRSALLGCIQTKVKKSPGVMRLTLTHNGGLEKVALPVRRPVARRFAQTLSRASPRGGSYLMLQDECAE